MKTKLFRTQTILDICVQETGTIETLFDMLKANNMQELQFNGEEELELIPPTKTRTVNYYKRNSILPATDWTTNRS